jgi:sporulation protein YlmC with PRC-barrel domain
MVHQERDNSAIHSGMEQTNSPLAASIAGRSMESNGVARNGQMSGVAGKSESKKSPLAIAAVSALIGAYVHNRQDEHLGSIKELMLNMHTGEIAYILLSFGDRFSILEKLFAIPWKALTPDPLNKRFVLNVEKNRLKNAPGFDWKNWPDMTDASWVSDIGEGDRI